MSGLAGLLAGHHPPGVYQWHAAFGPDDVRHTVEHAGARFAYVDGWTHQDRSEVLAAFEEALGLADGVADFDALGARLGDRLGEDTHLVLLWDGWGPLARSDPKAFDEAAGVLAGRAAQGAVSVLLRGEGPEVEVPSLDG
ncbi:MAG TPA: barstar family protein [Marmoricola sp.]